MVVYVFVCNRLWSLAGRRREARTTTEGEVFEWEQTGYGGKEVDGKAGDASQMGSAVDDAKELARQQELFALGLEEVGGVVRKRGYKSLEQLAEERAGRDGGRGAGLTPQIWSGRRTGGDAQIAHFGFILLAP